MHPCTTCVSLVRQCIMGCTQAWWQERVKYELNRRKPSVRGISVSFMAVSVLRAAWALEWRSTCSFYPHLTTPHHLRKWQNKIHKHLRHKHTTIHIACVSFSTAFQEGSNVVETQYQSTAASKRNLKVLILFMKENMQQGHRFHCQIILYVSSSHAAITELLHYASEQGMWCYFRYPLELSSHGSISFSCT